jgi:hypothetical protein
VIFISNFADQQGSKATKQQSTKAEMQKCTTASAKAGNQKQDLKIDILRYSFRILQISKAAKQQESKTAKHQSRNAEMQNSKCKIRKSETGFED